MKTLFNRTVSMVLVLAMLLSTMPLQVFAVNNEEAETHEAEAYLESDLIEAYSVDLLSADFEFSTLNGTVVDSSGNALSGVSVWIYNLDENVALTKCVTNASGNWSSAEYDAIVGYSYIVNYYKSGYDFVHNNIQCVAQSGGTTIETVTATQIAGLVFNEADYTYTTDTEAETATITGYTGTDAAIQLPSELGGYPVVAIGSNTFKKNTTLETVVFSENISTIGANAFENCSSLANVYLPNYLTAINNYAFNGCSNLASLELPNSITTIGRRAFQNCTKLASVNYPLSLSSVGDYNGGYIFEGCSSLTSIVVPEGVTAIPSQAFQGCTYLESITLPSTVTSIGSNAFSDCTGLDEISLPAGLKSIGNFAFSGCTGFTSLELPNSITTIGRRAFEDCTKLAFINYPLSLSSVGDYNGGYIFEGCSSLTSITVPEGVTALPGHAFSGANYLRTVSLPESLTTIGNRAFDNCEKLRVVIVPRNVITIGKYAFANCDDLRYVMLLGSKCSVGENLLTNSSKAFLYCPWTSKATVYAIKNDVDFYVLEDEDIDYSNYVVDMDATQYYTTANVAQVEKYVPLTLNYKFADDYYSDLSNCKIKLTLTSSLSIVPNSIFLNGKQVSMEDISYEDNELIVPVSEQSGTLQLSVTPVEAGKMMSTAEITYNRSGTNGSDIVGIIWLDVPMLTINAPSLISGNEFEVSGVTSANETVSLTVNGESVGTVISKKDGTFSKTITLPMPPVHGTAYTVAAVLESDTSVSTSTTVTYNTEAPILTQFDMYYYGHDLKYLNLLDTQTKANSIWPSKPLKFVVHFDNADSVTEVFVTSTKNGIVSRMQAFPTENTGEFIAEGFFVENSSSYVPGTINVQYSTKTTVEDYASDLTKEELPDEWSNSTAVVVSDTENEYQADITLSNGDEVAFDVQENVSLDQLRSTLLSTGDTPAVASTYSLSVASTEDWDIVKGFFEDLFSEYKDNVWSNVEDIATADEEQDVVAVIKDDTEQTLLYVFWDSAKDAFRTVGIKFVGTYWIHENSIGVSWGDCASAWGFIADGANVIVHGYNNAVSLNDAEADIRMSTTLTDEQKAYALEKVEQLRWGYAATGLLRIAAAAAGYGFTAAGNPILGALVKTVLNFTANLADDYLDKALAYYTAGSQGSYLKWILDLFMMLQQMNRSRELQLQHTGLSILKAILHSGIRRPTAVNTEQYGMRQSILSKTRF